MVKKIFRGTHAFYFRQGNNKNYLINPRDFEPIFGWKHSTKSRMDEFSLGVSEGFKTVRKEWCRWYLSG